MADSFHLVVITLNLFGIGFTFHVNAQQYCSQGSSERGEYVQAWQFSTEPGRIVTAVRVADMGVFFLIIEINSEC